MLPEPLTEFQWEKARRGKISASRLGDVLAHPGTKRRKGYLHDTVLDHGPAPDFQNAGEPAPWFRTGREFEQEGLGAYQWHVQADLYPGLGTDWRLFMLHPALSFVGCSPDGLVGLDGGFELKCTVVADNHLKVKRNGMPAVHKPQVQGCLWVTGRTFWDFGSYHVPTQDLAVVRIYPDEAYHNRLDAACREFWQEVQEELSGKRR